MIRTRTVRRICYGSMHDTSRLCMGSFFKQLDIVFVNRKGQFQDEGVIQPRKNHFSGIILYEFLSVGNV